MFALVPEIPVSEETLIWIRQHQLLGLSQRFVGMRFTYDGTWHGEWPEGHGHDEPRMGTLWSAICDCPDCLMVEWPGWHIRRTPDGYEGTDGERAVYGGTRTRFRCRLAAVTGWGEA